MCAAKSRRWRVVYEGQSTIQILVITFIKRFLIIFSKQRKLIVIAYKIFTATLMDIYIDNNILVSIENGDYSLDNIRELFPSKKLKFLYSSAHIFEANGLRDKKDISRELLLQKRFKSIRNIFKNNYLFIEPKDSRIYHIIEDPQEVFDTITLVPSGINAMKTMVNLITPGQKESYRQSLGIEPHLLNNYHPAEVIQHLNTKILIEGTQMSFMEMIERAVNCFPNANNIGIHERIAAIFELLDMLGYWRDKETDNSNYARLWDAFHTTFASNCDYFICDDKRARNKAGVVYNLYNKKTKIISSKGEEFSSALVHVRKIIKK
jgi:hypothetical protein